MHRKYTVEELEEALNNKKQTPMEKRTSFLDFMVKMVFFSTFLFTIVTMGIAYVLQLESLLIVLTEKWFNIMVGEIIVAGVIQIVKEFVELRGDRDE